MDGVRSKVTAQLDGSGFASRFTLPDSLRAERVRVNADAFSQIMINLVDNAIKFSARAEIRRVEIGCVRGADGRRLVFSVRDHEPGVQRDQMKKIFRLFYRSENELTRETVGTGIGLALVNRLARAMSAEVDVRNADPGAEFTVSFPPAR
jgi:signal transduction histidine kinase